MENGHYIAQAFVDGMARAVLTGAYEGYRARLKLPFMHYTNDGFRVFRDEISLRADFDTFCQLLGDVGADSLWQDVIGTKLMAPNRLMVYFNTHIDRAGRPVIPHYQNWVILKQHQGGGWYANVMTSFFIDGKSRMPRRASVGRMPRYG